MELTKAENIAKDLIEILKPYCTRIEVAGSVRRRKQEVKDIELVVIADKWKLEKYFVDNKNKYIFEKNGGKYKQFVFHSVKIDLFICNPDNWGLIFMLRTGSWEFSRDMLTKWKRVSKGGFSKDGYLYNQDGIKILNSLAEEKEIFELLQTEYLDPEDRN